MVGLIPLFATEVVDRRLLSRAPRFRDRLRMHKAACSTATTSAPARTGRTSAASTCSSWSITPCCSRILSRLLDEEQFLSPYGVRSVSASTPTPRDLGVLPGIGRR